jgi:lipoprotein signal peptidase
MSSSSERNPDLKRIGAFVISAVLTLAVAQLGSYLVDSRLPLGETYIVTSFLEFTHIRNTGGVFGSFQGNSALFAILSSAILIGVSGYLLRTKTADLFDSVCIGFLVGAGASNILDRLLYGAVIDFIDIRGIPHWGFIFNIADAMIHVGIWPLVIRHFFFTRSPRTVTLR